MNASAGFGYVRDKRGLRQYIFVLGDAIERLRGEKLRVGKEVRFHVDADGRVDQLVVG